jgi:rhomboid protease GluP
MLSLAIYAAVVTGVLAAGQPRAGAGTSLLRPWPVSTTATLIVIGTISTVQLAWMPALQTYLERDRAVVNSGQVWGLVTALTVQDGGVAGAVFNLVSLVVIGVVAEYLLGHRWWFVGFAVPALTAELVALSWQPVGAGNSVGVAGLCGAVVGLVVRRSAASLPAVLWLAPVVVLVLAHDIHGAAGVAGLVVGLGIRYQQGRQRM